MAIPINTIHRRILRSAPTPDLTTPSGRLALLEQLEGWMTFAAECLALSSELRLLGNKQQQAIYFQQWFNITVQLRAIRQLVENARHNTNQHAA